MGNTGQIIKRRRMQLGITQEGLATALGCSQTNIVKLEKGSIPDMRIGLLIQRCLGLDAARLFIDGEEALLDSIDATEQSQNEHVQAVIDLMYSVDERGMRKIRDAAEDALDKYRLQQNQLGVEIRPTPRHTATKKTTSANISHFEGSQQNFDNARIDNVAGRDTINTLSHKK